MNWLRKLFNTKPDGPTRGEILWGKYVIPQTLATRHFMACGATGTGKSTLLRMLYRSVLPDVLVDQFDTRALFYDPKSEAFPDLAALGLAKTTLVLNPFDARCTAWDVGRDVRDASQAKELAAIMVPPQEGANRYFYDASRLLIELAALSLIKLVGTDWSFRDLILACTNTGDLKVLADRAKLANRKAVDDFLAADREAKSVRMTLTVENSAYHAIAAAWDRARRAGRTFSLHDWVEGRGPRVLLVGASKQARTALATVNRLLLQRAQQLLLDYAEKDESTGRRTWVFLDEFPTLGSIPHLEELLTEGRSRGLCTVLGFQHISHVQKYYRDLADALLGQCLHQAYFRANDAPMAQWCAKNFGRIVKHEHYDGVPKMAVNDAASTENDFLFLPPASSERGFECIIRSADEVLPDGPKRIEVQPRPDLASIRSGKLDPATARFIPWKEPLEFQPWDAEERKRLGLPDEPPDGDAVPLPQNDFPDLLAASRALA